MPQTPNFSCGSHAGHSCKLTPDTVCRVILTATPWDVKTQQMPRPSSQIKKANANDQIHFSRLHPQNLCKALKRRLTKSFKFPEGNHGSVRISWRGFVLTQWMLPLDMVHDRQCFKGRQPRSRLKCLWQGLVAQAKGCLGHGSQAKPLKSDVRNRFMTC